MDRSTVIPVDNETTSCISRTTTEGRTITYEMTVLQQPVRARACGQGAKSSADRRPVDPPPIVELKIFEGPDRENDITFTMHANYFLFATLEAARPIAHGRVSADRHTPPVLTGTPVAGMVYLDRPKAAGYFIFPDLSVRHEGNYRLSFSLYEELKNVKDEDKSDEESNPADAAGPFVTHRLEVKSQPFQVFSAKKFPGLTESTTLSRVVAEQGCRVRIRRDVRMRRRDQKSRAKDWDDYEDDTAAARTRMSDTPESQPYPGIMHTPHSYRDPIPRPRSTSNTSLQSHTTSLSRRPSAQDVSNAHQTNQYGGAPPPPPQTGFSQPAPYALSPAPAYQQAPYIQQPAPMQPPPPQYQPIYSAPPPPAPVTAPQQSYYGYAPSQPVQPPSSAPQPPAFEPQQQHRANVDYAVQSQAEARRYPTQPTLPPPPHAQTSFPPQQSGYPPQSTYQQPPSTQAPQSSHSHSSSMDLYSNSRPMQSQGRTTPSTSMSGHPFNLPPLQTSTAMLSSGKLEASSPSSAAPSNSYLSAVQTPVDGTHKRSYGHVFSERYQDQPLRQGARPGATASDYSLVSGHSSSAADDEDTSGELDPDSLSMHYRRADGRAIRRALPGHV